MIVKHTVTEVFSLKGKIIIPDVIGIRDSNLLGPNKELRCIFEDINGEQFEIIGKTTQEFINLKGESENIDKIGGGLYFDEKPNNLMPKKWTLFVYIDENDL